MIRTLILALAALVALPACDTNEGQDFFFDQSRLAPMGITRTDESGDILGDPDPDDWRVAPTFEGSVQVSPATPNPVNRNGLVTITVQDTFGDILTGGVRAVGIDDSGQFRELDRDGGNGPFYTLTFSPTILRQVGGDGARLYRVRIFTQDSRIVSYGDLEVR